ncbi:hypothetical protein COO60DRAFT_1693701 [Scenedesmus sp. NREL 46B-D3]|nr:hypothetical protein COO60DRAFT_1693701 [Scenedesmus sp. NREL 46B-D3]
MARQGRTVLLLALATLAVQQLAVAAATAEEANPLKQLKVSFGRKLLQPFTLALQPITRVTSNAGRVTEKRIIANNNDVVAPQASGGSLLDTDPLVQEAITAQARSAIGSTNMDFGGVTKGTYQATGQSDQSTASTRTAADARSIGMPFSGRTASRVSEGSNSLAQRRIAPAGPIINTTEAERPRFVGPGDNRPLGAWEILAATGLDYTFAGDYDYSVFKALRADATGIATPKTYDYDYGQIQAIPQSAVTVGRTSTQLDNDVGRGAAFARMNHVAQAANAVARGNVRASGLWGTTAARANNDIFGRTPVFVPPNPFEQTGAGAASAIRGTTWKGAQRPAVALSSGNAGTTVSRNYISGGASDQINYVGATQSSNVRSENIALGSNENIDFNFGRRRRLAAAAQRRRLQGSQRGSGAALGCRRQ